MASRPKTKGRTVTAGDPGQSRIEAEEKTSADAALVPAGLGLKVLVFVSGAVLMALEIVGSRMLAPYFGNSVFVWGSLISLFLIALSGGYYIGGLLADRRPSRVLLNLIVLAVGASMFLMAAVAGPVCDEVARLGLGERAGPMLASSVLFLLPSIGMGMTSPFAVRLATHAVASVGKTAGTLYALSTLGSIVGTMLTTFVLIPAIGAEAILKGLAATLIGVAVATFPFASLGAGVRGAAIALAAIAAGIWGIAPTRASLPPGAVVHVDADTPYHHLMVIDDPTENSRELRFDRYVESKISLTPPHESQSLYTRYFHLAFLVQPEIRRALFIGAGGGVGPRTFHMHDPTMEIDVVDIDEKVLEAARTYFYLDDVANIRLHAVDGRSFVRDAPPAHYDAIILDAFTIGGRIPFHLVTHEFIDLCRSRLAPGGVFLMNINSAEAGPRSAIFRSMYKTLAGVFPQTHAFVLYRQHISADTSTNIILVAANGDQRLTHADWAARAAAYQSNSYVTREQIDAMLADLLITVPPTESAAEFTDDYAPIETMPF
jgi:spermidine synthase